MKEITRTIELNAEPETVYKWLTAPHHLQQWFSDHVEKTDDGYTFQWNVQDGNTVGFSVTTTQQDPHRRFAYKSAEDNVETRFDVATNGEKTIVLLTESGFGADKAGQKLYEEHNGGWDWFLSRLQQMDT